MILYKCDRCLMLGTPTKTYMPPKGWKSDAELGRIKEMITYCSQKHYCPSCVETLQSLEVFE